MGIPPFPQSSSAPVLEGLLVHLSARLEGSPFVMLGVPPIQSVDPPVAPALFWVLLRLRLLFLIQCKYLSMLLWGWELVFHLCTPSGGVSAS